MNLSSLNLFIHLELTEWQAITPVFFSFDFLGQYSNEAIWEAFVS